MPTITFSEALGGPVPNVEIEINLQGSGGLPSGEQIRSIIVVAERVTAGTLAANAISSTAFADADAGIAAFGANSPGAHMVAAIFDYNNNQRGSGRAKAEVWGAAIAEKATGTAAVQTLTFAAGPATSAGTFIFAIGGHRFSVPVAVGDVIADIKTATIAAWDALPQHKRCPVLLTDGGGGVVTLTGSVKGPHLNDIALETIQDPDTAITDAWSNTYMGGGAPGTSGIGAHAAGDFTALIANLASFNSAAQYVIPWCEDDAHAFNTVAPAAFRDHVISQGDATNMIPAYLRLGWKAAPATVVSAIAVLDTNDCERVSIATGSYSITGLSGTWSGEIAARYAAMRATQTHVGRSFDGLLFKDVDVSNAADNFTQGECKTLLEGGCSPLFQRPFSDTVEMCRDVCCRMDFGVLDTQVMDTLDYVRSDFAATLNAQPRMSIVDDDADLPLVEWITQPKAVKSALRARAEKLEAAGYLTNVATDWPSVVTNLSGSTLQMSIPLSLIPAWHNAQVRLDAAVPPGV